MLEIRYKSSLQTIEITLTDKLECWPSIRTAFQENAKEITSVGVNCIQLPVWAFLSSRHALVYSLRKHNIPFDVDDKVREILLISSKREGAYSASLNGLVVEPGLLLEKLSIEGFIRPLTANQIRNVLRLASLPSGATFSVPGSGKTTEALAYYYYRKAADDKLIVICPKNAFAAWEEQLGLCVKHTPQIVRLTGGETAIKAALEARAEVFLITYQQLPNVRGLIADYMLNHPTFMFLDESHHIKKGVDGQWSSTVLSLAHLPVSKLIMTGTPMPNSVADLIPQFNFIYPEMDTNSSNVETLIRPVFVRTTKGELNLPPVMRVLTPIRMLPRQRNLYEMLRSEESRQLSKLNSKDRSRLRRIGRSVVRLLQLVSNPALLLKEEIDLPDEIYLALAEGDSPKIEYACNKARKLAQQNSKVIIWSNFVENVETIAMRLSDLGADYIHGGVDAGNEEEENTREKKIARFHADSAAYVLVANPAACAEAISLHTVCHHAIYVDRNYNAAQYLQSEDRIHRLGLAPDIRTTVEILHCADTVDESVLRRLNAKVARMAKVLDDTSLNIEPFEPDLESDGLREEDAEDFLKHLNRL